MILQSPMIITSRLKPGIKVGDSTISIMDYGRNFEGRTEYKYWIDTPDFEYDNDDMKSGCQGGSVKEGLESLLSFLGACGESYAYEMRTGIEGDNLDLFPQHVAEWCYQNSDELSMVAYELEQGVEL
jgi:hypothetical protein